MNRSTYIERDPLELTDLALSPAEKIIFSAIQFDKRYPEAQYNNKALQAFIDKQKNIQLQDLVLSLNTIAAQFIYQKSNSTNIEEHYKCMRILIDKITSHPEKTETCIGNATKNIFFFCNPEVIERYSEPDASLLSLCFAVTEINDNCSNLLTPKNLPLEMKPNLSLFEKYKARHIQGIKKLLGYLLIKLKSATDQKMIGVAYALSFLRNEKILVSFIQPHIKTLTAIHSILSEAIFHTDNIKLFYTGLTLARQYLTSQECIRLQEELLYKTIESQRYDLLNILLDAPYNTDVDAKNISINTDLIKKKNDGTVEIVKMAITFTPMMHAKKDEKAIDILLKYKPNLLLVNISLTDNDKKTGVDRFNHAIHCNSTIEMRYGANVAIQAANQGNLSSLIKFLKLGIDINSRSLEGLTPLHVAAGSNHLHIVEYLLKNNANIHYTTRGGRTRSSTALEMATINKNANIITAISLAYLKEWLEHAVHNNLELKLSINIPVILKQLNTVNVLFNDSKIYIKIDTERTVILDQSNLLYILKKLPKYHSKEQLIELLFQSQNIHTHTITPPENPLNSIPLSQQIAQLKSDIEASFIIISEAETIAKDALLILSRASSPGKLAQSIPNKCTRVTRLITRLKSLQNECNLNQLNIVDLKKQFDSITQIANPLKILINDIENKIEILEHTQTQKTSKNKELSVEIQEKLYSSKLSPPTVAKPLEKKSSQPATMPYKKSKSLTATSKKHVITLEKLKSIDIKETKEIKQLRQLLELPVDDTKPEIRALCRNALLLLCAKLLAKSHWHARNALFHHHDVLPIAGNNQEQEETQYNQIVDLAYALVNGSSSTLLEKISATDYVIPEETVQQCIVQLNYGLDDLNLYAKLDKDLFPEFVIKAAEGFMAARLSTYVTPFLNKEHLGDFADSENSRKIHELVKCARPFKKAGNKARHDEPFSLPKGYMSKSLFKPTDGTDLVKPDINPTTHILNKPSQ